MSPLGMLPYADIKEAFPSEATPTVDVQVSKTAEELGELRKTLTSTAETLASMQYNIGIGRWSLGGNNVVLMLACGAVAMELWQNATDHARAPRYMLDKALSACVGVLLWENVLSEHNRSQARALASALWEQCQGVTRRAE